MKNLLFITWDGPQTSYMEGLFMPIFHEISKLDDIKFHVMQFTWADQQKLNQIKAAAQEYGIHYTSQTIQRKPVATIGSLYTLFSSSHKIAQYIKDNDIDIVMPRSNFPAFMLNKIKTKDFKIIFDADGLPIEERVDFAGLKKNGWMYNWLKSIETNMLIKADAVITRSQKSIDIHVNNIGEEFRDKFSIVSNGRDIEHFKPNPTQRQLIRESLHLKDSDVLFVSCGSLGPQYGWEEMISIFEGFLKDHPGSHFLILTGNTEFAETNLPTQLKRYCTIKSVPFVEVPNYLSAADIAFAIRQPTYSMQGVAPIKLGEYLLMNLPTIASKGIGDSEEILQDFKNCYLYDHDLSLEHQKETIENWIKPNADAKINHIRETALSYFSLEAAAKSYFSAIKTLIN